MRVLFTVGVDVQLLGILFIATGLLIPFTSDMEFEDDGVPVSSPI